MIANSTIKVFDQLELVFNKTLVTNINIVYDNLVTHGVNKWVPVIVVLWFAFEGWKMWLGMSKQTLQYFIRDSLIVVFVVAIALNSNKIGTNFIDNITQWPDHLASIVDGEAQVKTMKLLDGMVAMAYDASQAVFASYTASSLFPDWTSLAVFCAGVGVLAIGIINACIAAGIYFVAKFSMAVLLSTGCIFIIFSLWDYTRGWFTAWLNYIAMCIVLVLLVTLTVKFNFILSAQSFASIPDKLSETPVLDSLNILITNVVGLVFLMSCPSIASSLTSSGSLNIPERTAKNMIIGLSKYAGSKNYGGLKWGGGKVVGSFSRKSNQPKNSIS